MHYRGELEGGVSLRRFENLFDDSERRYFSLNGQVFSADGEIPDIVHQIASRIKTPFYSIDIAKNANGELRLIEIGDGQVSDTKEWSVADLVTAFCIAGG
ncbi:ATP-grasp domain-containing protein [Serratia marcescens]|nr:ATP-grasp domain-containing protein [Serratia marcescens]